MKKSWILLTACAALLSGVEAIACTGLLVGKKASTDGSVMISYAADSHSLYGRCIVGPPYMAEGRHVGSEGMGYGKTAGQDRPSGEYLFRSG